MAQMYPDAGPAEDCESSAERALYYRLRETLGPEYTVVHSAKWNVVAGNGRMQAGEADFIIIHPAKGILVLEVKGGRVRYDPKAGRWYVLDRHNHQDRIRDPFTQAMASTKILGRKLSAVARTRPYASLYRMAYGVWFPDMDWPRQQGGELRLIDEQVLYRVDLRQPESALDRLFRFAQGTLTLPPALPLDAMTALLNLLAPDLTPVESPLARSFDEDSAQLARLTYEQSARLAAMWHAYRQLAIPGHAGTGKTVLAMEMAWRLADTGSHVLLLCANQTLAEHLLARLTADPRWNGDNFGDNFTVWSLRDLLTTAAHLGGRKRDEAGRLDALSSPGQKNLAAILMENLHVLATKGTPLLFDAILVDEAQDIDEPVWAPLHSMLRAADDPAEAMETTEGTQEDTESNAASHFYAFYDPAQRIIPGEWDPAWTGLPVLDPPLARNCRNTQAIYQLMATLNPRLREAPFIGPAGRPIDFIDPMPLAKEAVPADVRGRRRDGESIALERVLDDLTSHQGIKPEHILVITCRSTTSGSANATRWLRASEQDIGRHRLRWLGAKRPAGFISFATIRSAKGMEAPVVVLVELDGIGEQDKRRDQLLFTAVSRARFHLIVLGQREDVAPRHPGWWERLWNGGSSHTSTGTSAPADGHVRIVRLPDLDEAVPFAVDDPGAKEDTIYVGDASDANGATSTSTRFDGAASDAADQARTRSRRRTNGLASEAPPYEGSNSSQGNDSAGSSAAAGGAGTTGAQRHHQPSHFQQGIYDFVVSGSGDGIVDAVAGSGKTTTLVEAAKLITERDALFLAFNVHIAKELKKRLKGTPMMARTIHSVGWRVLARYLSSPDKELELRKHKYGRLCRQWVDSHVVTHGSETERDEAVAALCKLVDLARLTLTPSDNTSALRSLALHHGIDCDPKVLPILLTGVYEVIHAGVEIAREQKEIDYTDMVYLPYHWRLHPRKVGWVFVDEAQDLNAAQLDLVLKCRARGGRMLFVGDPHQAIYGFAGADTHSFESIKRRTHAKDLPLSICYRCPKSHVALARAIVPNIEHHADAPEGVIAHVPSATMHVQVTKGDLILCRKTAPLIEECIRLIRHHVHARVKGRDIGKDLEVVVQDVTRVPGYTWERFGVVLETYEQLQTEKLAQLEGSEGLIERLRDRVAAVRVCYEMFQARDAGELCTHIADLFHDEQPDVILSTVHRAKGLEADRIFILNEGDMPLQWPGQQPWEVEQENNIRYVALTRAKQELFFIDEGPAAVPAEATTRASAYRPSD